MGVGYIDWITCVVILLMYSNLITNNLLNYTNILIKFNKILIEWEFINNMHVLLLFI